MKPKWAKRYKRFTYSITIHTMKTSQATFEKNFLIYRDRIPGETEWTIMFSSNELDDVYDYIEKNDYKCVYSNIDKKIIIRNTNTI